MSCSYESESIYNLIPKEFHSPARQAKHKSKFKDNVKQELSTQKDGHKTFGLAKYPVPGPDNFLKKHEKEPKLPPKQPFNYGDDKRKPAVPKVEDQPVLGLKTNKNFITQNACTAIMSVPKKAEKIYCDTKIGDKQPLETSGLEPKYVHKREYGETPAYLLKRNEEMRKAQEEYDAYVAEHFRRGAMKQLTNLDRDGIIDGLKSNWEQIHHEYQGLSVVTDTAPKKHRKERMEAEMKQLERDIELIEKHKVIYIAN